MDTSKLCSVEGCGKPSNKRGMCYMHYQRVLRGTPIERPARTTPGDRLRWLIGHLEYDGDDCLIWPFSRTNKGYAQVSVNGRLTGAHREMCQRKHGDPPSKEYETAHRCGRGHDGCVNPKHLRWATGSENQFERVDHGTDSRGEKCGTHKLKEDQVRYIKSAHGSVSARDLGVMFGVTHHAIQKIFDGKNWSWLN